MGQFLGLVAFHFKLFAKNSYFFWLMVTSTISLLCLQYLAAYAGGALADPYVWRRAAIFGLWSCGTTACGSIGFQRSQGTLLYLLNTKTSDQVSLAAVIVPAASFGLLCFPLAYVLAWGLGLERSLGQGWTFLLTVIALWAGAVVLDLAIAGLFVLTPRALVYEEVVTLPLLFLSGLFELPGKWQLLEVIGRYLLPIAVPIQALTRGESLSPLSWGAYGLSLLAWGLLSYRLSVILLKRAKQSGQLGGIGL